MLITSVLGVGLGLTQAVMGLSAQRRAKKKMDELRFQDLSKSATEGISPSMKLLEDQLERVRVQTAQGAEVAQQQGAAGAQSMIGGITAAGLDAQSKIYGTMLDRQYQYDVMSVQDAQQRRNLQEARDTRTAQSLAQEYTAGQQTMLSGVQGALEMGSVVEAQLKDDLSDTQAAEMMARIRLANQMRNQPSPVIE